MASKHEQLEHKAIQKWINEELRAKITHFDIFEKIDSTNTFLLDAAKNHQIGYHICLAEQQSAGRGRYNHNWLSPPGNIYMSLAHEQHRTTTGLHAVIALTILRTFKKMGITKLRCKWPNDILYQNKKLAGILIENTHNKHKKNVTVIGIGINIDLSKTQPHTIDQPWTDLLSITKKQISRHHIIGFLINEILTAVEEFERFGLAPFLKEWHNVDALLNQEITVQTPHGVMTGIAQGINPQGKLILKTDSRCHTITSGSILNR